MSQSILYLKLVSGDDIVAVCEDKKDIMKIKEPLQLHTYNTNFGASVRFSKWIPHVEKNVFEIHSEDIMVAAEPQNDIKKYYTTSIKKMKDMEHYYEKEELEDELSFDKLKEYMDMLRLANNDITVH